MNSFVIYLIFCTMVAVAITLSFLMYSWSIKVRNAQKQAKEEGKILIEEVRKVRSSVDILQQISAYKTNKTFSNKQFIVLTFEIVKDLLSIRKSLPSKIISIFKIMFKLLRTTRILSNTVN